MKRDNSVCSGLAGILAFALVLGKLDPETLLRVRNRNPLHCLHWNVELTIAKSADADSRECAQPFEDPKITFRHFPTQVRHAGQVPTTTGNVNKPSSVSDSAKWWPLGPADESGGGNSAPGGPPHGRTRGRVSHEALGNVDQRRHHST